MLEREVEAAVCAYAKTKGMIHYKFSSPAHRGTPDRIFFAPEGVVFLIEFKREGEKPTPSQVREAARISHMLTAVYLVDSVESGKEIIDGEYENYVLRQQMRALLAAQQDGTRH